MAGMKLPTRPAPEPPKDQCQKQNRSILRAPSEKRDSILDQFKLSRSQSAGKLGENNKPPRPPPPPAVKLLTVSKSSTSSNRTKSTQLVSSLFTTNKSGGSTPKNQTCLRLSEQPGAKKQTTACGLLIDFNSPPSSPALTPCSSSDGFSVNSFGSDGILTGVNTASSQVESGFEDDFDLLLLSEVTTPAVLDPWMDHSFSNTRHAAQSSVTFELSNEDPRLRHKVPSNTNLVTSTKPTIIRPKNSKPARPPPPKLRPSSTPPKFVSSSLDSPSDDWSPPMPNCPPPPPPPEVLTTLEHGPNLPPRPSTLMQENAEKKKPYCIALYNYEAGHPDDLSFRVNDVIHLTEQVNNDWLRGRLMDKEGMFPASYTKIVVPLENFRPRNVDNIKHVIALYTFKPETWDDLPFQEGETVKVTKRVNDHWLYGECNGRQGQFPENYVTDISSSLPLQTTYS